MFKILIHSIFVCESIIINVEKLFTLENLYIALGILMLIVIGISVVYLFMGRNVVKTNLSGKKNKAALHYYLPESVIKIAATAKVAVSYSEDQITGAEVISLKFAISTELAADTENLLLLNYTPNPLMSDDVKFKVNAKGLLETAGITAEDRIGEIISQIAAVPAAALEAKALRVTEAEAKNVSIQEISEEFTFRASVLAEPEGMPITWKMLIANQLNEKLYFPLDFDFTISSAEMQPEAQAKKLPVDDKGAPGILTRPLKNIRLKFSSTTYNFSDSQFPTVAVADTSRVVLIPVSRTPFVKRVNTLGFQDGMIVSNDIANPSSVEGFVSIPINILKALVSIPAQLVKFKYDNTVKQKELETAKLEHQKALAESEKYQVTKGTDMEKAKLEYQKALAEKEKHDLTKNSELEKVKLEYQKALAEKEKYDLTKNTELEKVKLEYQKSILENQKYNATRDAELEKAKLEMTKTIAEAQKTILATQQAIEALKAKS